MLLGTILLDTYNFDLKMNKGTPTDANIVSQLSQLLQLSDSDKKQLYDFLTEKRFDQSALSTWDVLRADYKQFTMGHVEVGISSVRRKVSDWLKQESHFVKELHRYLTALHLDILFVMTSFFPEPEHVARELICFCTDKARFDETVSELLQSKELDLVRLSISIAETEATTKEAHTAFFSQRNAAASRKQLQPYLLNFYTRNKT